MGKKPAARQPSPMWVTTADLPTSAGHPFFERLNRVLEEAGFDAFVEGLCAVFYASRLGRPSLRPGRYFRLLFIGYFEGLSSERGIAWRVADSLSLRAFLDLDVTEAPPNHSTLSRTRRLIDVETHVAVFTWVLERLAGAGLVQGKTVGVDATTLEANAAMRSIERRDTGESYEAFVRQLAKASGIETPTRAELARFDRSRKDRKTSNKEWQSPQDTDAKIAKMKDGRTHLAHKAEHGILENVPNLKRHNEGETWRDLEGEFVRAGYTMSSAYLSPHQFGVPQIRERLFIVGSRNGLNHFTWPQPHATKGLSVRSVLDEVPADQKALSPRAIRCLQIWQQFIERFPPGEALPWFPIWTAEFGSTYPYEDITPWAMRRMDHQALPAELAKAGMELQSRRERHLELRHSVPRLWRSCQATNDRSVARCHDHYASAGSRRQQHRLPIAHPVQLHAASSRRSGLSARLQ